MNTLLVVLIVFIFVGFAVVFYLLHKRLKPKDTSGDQSLLMLQNQLADLSRVLDHKLTESSRTIDQKLSESARVLQHSFTQSASIIKDVTERLTKLDATNQRVTDFASQLQNLQDILKNPKQRGLLGEYYLETVLGNVLPPQAFALQYSFGDGTIVDAAVFIKEKIIPVDSKFSLENYNRLIETKDETERKKYEDLLRIDLKTRIDETSKYIKPDKGTMDFAFMFIPSEAIYYDLLINKVGSINAKDLIEYAFNQKKVIIVSPTSFFAYLQTVLQGLRALQIEESAKEIRKRVEDLGRHLGAYETYMKKVGAHLGTAVNMYNSADKEFSKIEKDVLRITDKAPEELGKLSASEE